MRRITLKKTSPPSTNDYIKRGRMTTPASYDIYLDGQRVGKMWGYCQTRLSDGGCGHKAEAFGQRLSNAAPRGRERARMEEEIMELAALKRPKQ